MNEKILIVDDDMAIATLISDALEDEGFETVVVSDGNTAYSYVLSHGKDISLITLDIMMPEVSGIDLCKAIRDVVSCPIIFVSAKSKTVDTVLGLEIGDDYIAKPFVVEEFVARTGVDSLAIAIGTSHGLHKFSGEAKLRLSYSCLHLQHHPQKHASGLL